MPGIYWLASYPKSGNTWLRAFLANYQAWPQAPSDLGKLLGGTGIASNRQWFDEATGLNSSEMSRDEVADLRPKVYEHMARSASEPLYIKIHDARILTPSGAPSIPKDASLGIIYVIRNPLAIAVSYAKHGDLPTDTMIDRMADETYELATRDLGSSLQLPQPVLSWSSHVQSWTLGTDIPILTIRYEDMLERSESVFGAVIRFLDWPYDKDRLHGAIEGSSFQRLSQLEQRAGFPEVLSSKRRFFRAGRSDSWRAELNAEQIAALAKRHHTEMNQWDYSTTGLF